MLRESRADPRTLPQKIVLRGVIHCRTIDFGKTDRDSRIDAPSKYQSKSCRKRSDRSGSIILVQWL
jgi:hypothetical protein